MALAPRFRDNSRIGTLMQSKGDVGTSAVAATNDNSPKIICHTKAAKKSDRVGTSCEGKWGIKPRAMLVTG